VRVWVPVPVPVTVEVALKGGGVKVEVRLDVAVGVRVTVLVGVRLGVMVKVPTTQLGIWPPAKVAYTAEVSVFVSVPWGLNPVTGPKVFTLPPLSVMRI
jgi:hypothetical protein